MDVVKPYKTITAVELRAMIEAMTNEGLKDQYLDLQKHMVIGVSSRELR